MKNKKKESNSLQQLLQLPNTIRRGVMTQRAVHHVSYRCHPTYTR